MPLADSIEVRSDDPYAGRPDADMQAALAARGPASAYVGAAEVQQFLVGAKAETVAKAYVAVSEVTRPGSGPDAFDRERYHLTTWMRNVGRVPSPEELAGRPVPGCVACSRLAGLVCEEHTRKTGEPLDYPPHPWPSEAPGAVPGGIVLRPGMAPYRLDAQPWRSPWPLPGPPTCQRCGGACVRG